MTDFLKIGIDILLYFRNTRLDRQREALEARHV